MMISDLIWVNEHDTRVLQLDGMSVTVTLLLIHFLTLNQLRQCDPALGKEARAPRPLETVAAPPTCRSSLHLRLHLRLSYSLPLLGLFLPLGIRNPHLPSFISRKETLITVSSSHSLISGPPLLFSPNNDHALVTLSVIPHLYPSLSLGTFSFFSLGSKSIATSSPLLFLSRISTLYDPIRPPPVA